jgi:hypothetical protein
LGIADCREAWVSGYESSDYRLTNDQGYTDGRATDITITVTAQGRI